MKSRLPIPASIFRQAINLAIPVSIANMLIVGALVFEVIMVSGTLGAEGIAAIGLAGAFTLVLILSFHALEVGCQTIVARRWGETDYKQAGATVNSAMILSFTMGTAICALLFIFAPFVFISASSQTIRDLSVEYLRWRLPGIPFLIASLAIIGFLNGIGKPKISAFVYLWVLLLNIILLVILVPRMGMAGAGLAGSISAIFGFILFLGVLAHPRCRRKYHTLWPRVPTNTGLWKRILKLSAPIFVQQFVSNFAVFIFLSILAAVPDGGLALSAGTIARNINYLTYLPGVGFGTAAATLVSQYLGAMQKRRAAMASWACWVSGATLMCLGGVLFIFFRVEIVRLFLYFAEDTNGIDPTSLITTTSYVLILVGFSQVFESLNTILAKTFQGAGHTKLVMVQTILAQWIVLLPLAWILTIYFELSVIGAWYALTISLAYLGTSYMLFIRYTDWKSKVV